jgi:hypothetical protein
MGGGLGCFGGDSSSVCLEEVGGGGRLWHSRGAASAAGGRWATGSAGGAVGLRRPWSNCGQTCGAFSTGSHIRAVQSTWPRCS